MTPQILGLIIGGVLPAVLYGTSSVFAKTSTNAGMPVGIHLFWIGLAISTTGILFSLVLPEQSPSLVPSLNGVASSSMLGFLWGLGTGCVALGLIQYQTPLAKLVPLYNMNTLITVCLALILFAEWKEMNVVKLMIGAAFTIVGGILVSGA